MTTLNTEQQNKADKNLSQRLESLSFQNDLFNETILKQYELNKATQEANILYPEDATPEQVNQLPQIQAQMQQDLLVRFEANMNAFKKYFKDIYDQFINFKPSEPLEFTCSTNGIPNLYFPNQKKFFYNSLNPIATCDHQIDLALKYSPLLIAGYILQKDPYGQIHFRYLNESIKLYNSYIPENEGSRAVFLQESCPCIFCFGCGLGYYLDALYSKVDVGNLILMEPNQDLFYASLYTFDWYHLFDYLVQNNRGIFFVLGQENHETEQILKAYFNRHGNMLAGDAWLFMHYQTPELLELYNSIKHKFLISSSIVGFFDDHLFEISHSFKCLENKIPLLSQKKLLPQFMRDTPICVVGNGPSLSKDLDFLRKNQDHVYIIACGSALETLYLEGIKPHFYACTERTDEPLLVLDLIPDKSFFEDIILLSSNVAHPKVFTYFKHKAIFIKADESFVWMLVSNCQEKIKDVALISMMNPLVGNLGVSIASCLQFKKIYLFGLDNGTTEQDLALHAKSSVLYQKTAEHNQKIRNALSKAYTGNFGNTVYTSGIYEISANNIEVMIHFTKKLHNTQYFNCSDGMKYDGADPVHSSDLDFTDLPKIDQQKLIDLFENKLSFTLDLTEEEKQKLYAYDIFDSVINDLITQIKELQDPATTKDRLDFALKLQTIIEKTNLLDNKHMFATTAIMGSVMTFFFELYKTLYNVKDFDFAKKITSEQIDLLIYFLEDAKKLYRFIPNYVAIEHMSLTNHKIGYDHPNSLAPTFVSDAFKISQADVDKYQMRKFVKRYE